MQIAQSELINSLLELTSEMLGRHSADTIRIRDKKEEETTRAMQTAAETALRGYEITRSARRGRMWSPG